MHFRMSVGSANLSLLDEGNFTFLEDFEVFTFRDAVNVAAYMVMSAGQWRWYIKEQININIDIVHRYLHHRYIIICIFCAWSKN